MTVTQALKSQYKDFGTIFGYNSFPQGRGRVTMVWTVPVACSRRLPNPPYEVSES